MHFTTGYTLAMMLKRLHFVVDLVTQLIRDLNIRPVLVPVFGRNKYYRCHGYPHSHAVNHSVSHAPCRRTFRQAHLEQPLLVC